ncbi:MAG: ORF6N domain-containing protein [Bacteroidaceae bacterium]|nr:ORF6N domain-containing protein [Bacteroidaceae bacterium]
MLDFDLAEMYAVETRVLNQAVKRNIERFPAFVRIRQNLSLLSIPMKLSELEHRITDLSKEVNDILRDQNDINEETRVQLDAISTALAELQAKPKEEKPRRRIGFIQDDK